jgi:hypothetical protein
MHGALWLRKTERKIKELRPHARIGLLEAETDP